MPANQERSTAAKAASAKFAAESKVRQSARQAGRFDANEAAGKKSRVKQVRAAGARDAAAVAKTAAAKAQLDADNLKAKRGLKLVNASSASRLSLIKTRSPELGVKTQARANIKNPKRAALRKKARIGGSTQFVVPSLGVS